MKCSSRLYDDLSGKKKRRKCNYVEDGPLPHQKQVEGSGQKLGGEMSGHIFFKNRFYGFDDAVYASSRLCEIVSNFSGKASELLADLPKMIATPEIRVDCPEEIKFKIPELAKKEFPGQKLITIDGVRIEFDKGWCSSGHRTPSQYL